MFRFLKGVLSLFGALFIVFVGLGLAGVWDKPDHQSNARPVAAQAAIAVSPKRPMPADQAALLDVVMRFSTQYRGAANDMLKGATRPARAAALCKVVVNRQVKDWIGTIKKMSTNADGKGVLEVALDDNASVKTWNNDLSDSGDNTMIPVNSALFNTVAHLSVGNAVTFSGSFFANPSDCLHEVSMSVSGAMEEPEFLFRFTKVAPAD
jgi:hypothetical protein